MKRAAQPASRRAPADAELWREAYDRLLSDPAFGALVRRVGPVRFTPSSHDTFSFLVRSVTFQQLAGKAAATIHGRVVAALGGAVTPEAILETPEDDLRGAGLSRAKLACIRDFAQKVADRSVELGDLEDLEDEAVIERLVGVRGIGRWTAQMALIFHLRRPDVWPVADLGVRAGMGRVLGMDEPPSTKEMELIGIGYRPWRSATAWYCWRALEPAAAD